MFVTVSNDVHFFIKNQLAGQFSAPLVIAPVAIASKINTTTTRVRFKQPGGTQGAAF